MIVNQGLLSSPAAYSANKFFSYFSICSITSVVTPVKEKPPS
jgi:hypothetical protein